MSDKELNAYIAKKISYYLKEQQRTQLELAEYMGVSQTTVSNWCNGVKIPRMNKIDRICEFFNVPRSALMVETDSEPDSRSTLHNIPATIAAHFDGEEFSEEQIQQINDFIDFVKSKNGSHGTKK